LGEATIIRNDEASNLPANARVLYVGDYNPDDNSGEPGYQTICSNSAPDGIKQGQGVDPLNILWGPYTDASTTINWSVSTTSPSILFMLSEESYELRYRDDLQIMTSNVYYDVAGGFQYVQGSYHSFGNNASLPYQDSVNTSGNTALNDLDPTLTNLTGLSAAVLLEDLTGASDHLPIVADYTIPIPSTAPVASFTASPTNGAAPLAVTFTDTSTGGTNWAWTFGDGGTTNLVTNVVAYTYSTAGVYSVTEIVSGTGGSSTDAVANCITVLPPAPVASFTASPTNGAAPLGVSFTDTSSNSPTSWSWTFGDNGTSTSQNPSYTYITPGAYTVTLIASNAGGSGTSAQTTLINVYDRFAWWQLQYFGSTNIAASTAPDGDYTGAGMSNTNKFLAGFNPTNAAAYLHVISIAEQLVAGTTNVVVTYLGPNGDNSYTPGIASRTNVLDYTTGAADGSYTNGGWQDTGQTNILGGGNGSGTITSMTDTNIPASSDRYYRVRVLPP
jgi:PKD repeat protein